LHEFLPQQCGLHAVAGAHEQRITKVLAQAGKGNANRRLAQPDALAVRLTDRVL
jgi:hypothetical protein